MSESFSISSLVSYFIEKPPFQLRADKLLSKAHLFPDVCHKVLKLRFLQTEREVAHDTLNAVGGVLFLAQGGRFLILAQLTADFPQEIVNVCLGKAGGE